MRIAKVQKFLDFKAEKGRKHKIIAKKLGSY